MKFGRGRDRNAYTSLRGEKERAKKLYWELLDESPDSAYIRRELEELE